MKEIWKPIIECPDFHISSFGQVKRIRHKYKKLIGIVRTNLNNYGYPQFSMQCKSTMVHKHVARAFIGPRPEGYQINHKDGVKTNNHVYNLEYVTPHENNQHALKLGLYDLQGTRHPLSKLTDYRVNKIRKLLFSMNISAIAVRFNVSRKLIRNIRDRKTWKHI